VVQNVANVRVDHVQIDRLAGEARSPIAAALFGLLRLVLACRRTIRRGWRRLGAIRPSYRGGFAFDSDRFAGHNERVTRQSNDARDGACFRDFKFQRLLRHYSLLRDWTSLAVTRWFGCLLRTFERAALKRQLSLSCQNRTIGQDGLI